MIVKKNWHFSPLLGTLRTSLLFCYWLIGEQNPFNAFSNVFFFLSLPGDLRANRWVLECPLFFNKIPQRVVIVPCMPFVKFIADFYRNFVVTFIRYSPFHIRIPFTSIFWRAVYYYTLADLSRPATVAHHKIKSITNF